MGAPTSVLDRLEALQIWAYQALGRDPDGIPADIDSMKTRKRPPLWEMPDPAETSKDIAGSPIETDAEMLAANEEIYANWRTTRYQDPVILSAICLPYDDVIRGYQGVSADRLRSIERPIVCTIPVSMLNGFALQDETGAYGIVLQEGMRFFPILLANGVGKYLFRPVGDRIAIDMSGENVMAALSEDGQALSGLVDCFVMDALSRGMPAPSREAYERSSASVELEVCHLKIQLGFNFFVLAHEYAHCALGHLDQITNKSDRGYAMRSPQQIDAALELYRAKYAHLEPPGDDQMLAFAVTHVLEFEADQLAAQCLATHLRERDPNLDGGDGLVMLIGVYLFFWYVEMTERVHRTLHLGNAWFSDDLYGPDLLVQDLLHRPTHPTPLERMQRVKWTIAEALTDEIARERAKSAHDWLYITFERAWANRRDDVVAAWSEHYRLNSKWVETLPDVGVALGASYRQKDLKLK